VAQRLIQNLDTSRINGTVIIVPLVGQLGTARISRFYPTAPSGGSLTDPNRLFPGNPLGNVVSRFDWAIWNGLTKNGTQVDYAVDMHTTSSGSATPLWCYSDYAVPEIQRMAELIGADIIKVDPGEPGSLETTFVEYGIPAITLEIASPRIWQGEYIDRAYDFILRALAEFQVYPGDVTVPDVDTYVGATFEPVVAQTAGFWSPSVVLNQDVEEGQLLGFLYNTWGDVLSNYTAPIAGRVHTLATDPALEPGRSVATLITDRQ